MSKVYETFFPDSTEGRSTSARGTVIPSRRGCLAFATSVGRRARAKRDRRKENGGIRDPAVGVTKNFGSRGLTACGVGGARRVQDPFRRAGDWRARELPRR